jgi:hypothetical protein
MPPEKKKESSQKGKQSEKTDSAKKVGKQTSNDVIHQPIYISMGKKRVQFLHDAAVLDKVLKDTYGSDFSISKFEKSLVELKGKSTLRDLIHLPNEILALHAVYISSKQQMVEESSVLKKSFLSAPIASSAITTTDELFAEDAPPSKAKKDSKEESDKEPSDKEKVAE